MAKKRTRIIAPRRDTAANWSAANPVLAINEIAYASDSDLYKIGDGLKNWNDLGYSVTLNPSYVVLEAPDATLLTGAWILVTNETGGAVMAFSDGSNWLRCTDREIIS